MKEFFKDKKFTPASLAMLEHINAILDVYAANDYDLSTRQLFYQLVSRNLVPNTLKSYKSISSLVSDARLAGLMDWDMIKDRTREVVENPHWGKPLEFIKDVAAQYRFNLWEDQDNYVEIMVEKQALEGVLIPVCRRLDVAFTANRGYSSTATMYEASKRFIAARDEGKSLFIIYLGDHDPSGIDMTRDVAERTELFLGGVDAEVRRIALNMDQVRKLRPPKNPAKLTDARAKGYIKTFGPDSWELDAIEPGALGKLVTDAVTELMDVPLFNKNHKRMMGERSELVKFANTYLK